MVQDGTAFCANCNAPQIRVASPEAEPPVFVPGTPGEIQPPAQPVSLHSTPPVLPGQINWSAATKALWIAGLLIGFTSLLPLGFVWIAGGGALAVTLYLRKFPERPRLARSMGAKIGAVSGVIGYAVFSVVAGIQFLRDPGPVREMLNQALQNAKTQNPDPRVTEMYDKFASPAGTALILTFTMVFLLAMFLVLSSLGGALAASVARRNESR